MWMTTGHSIQPRKCNSSGAFPGNHYWFVFWFLFDSFGLGQTECQSQDLNRNYFAVVFQLTRDKLVPKITSTPFLPHIRTKRRNTQPLCLLFWCIIQIEHFWEIELKIGEHEYILIFHEIKIQGPEIKDRQVASDIWREIFTATIGLMDSKYFSTRSLAFGYCNIAFGNCNTLFLIRWVGQLDIASARYHAIAFSFLEFCFCICFCNIFHRSPWGWISLPFIMVELYNI